MALCRTWVAAVLVLAALVTPAAPASAREPEITDVCGDGVIARQESRVEAHPGWQDVCSAGFESLMSVDGRRGVQVRVTLADTLTDRSPSSYQVYWTVSNCTYRVDIVDGQWPTTPEAEVTSVDRQLSVMCDDELTRSCVLLGACSDRPKPVDSVIPTARVSVAGKTLSVMLFSSDVAAPRRAHFTEGALLERLYVRTGQSIAGLSWRTQTCVQGGGTLPSPCVVGGDETGYGRTYAIPAHADRVVADPYGCPGGLNATADRPNITDPAGDQQARGPQSLSGDGHDLRGVWLGGKGTTVNILPSGPAAEPQGLAYRVVLDGGRSVEAHTTTDGRWHFRYYGGSSPATNTTGTVDPATGRVTVQLRDAAPTPTSLERAFAMYVTPRRQVAPGTPDTLVFATQPVDVTDPDARCGFFDA